MLRLRDERRTRRYGIFPLPEEPFARPFRAATLLPEHRRDGHVAALLSHQVGGTESHFLGAVAVGMRGADSAVEPITACLTVEAAP